MSDRIEGGLVSNVQTVWSGLTADGRSAMFELRFAAPADPQTPAPSLFSALQEQRGLKPEPTPAPVRVLMIDGAEHPDAN